MYRLNVKIKAFGRQTVHGHVMWPITKSWGSRHITGTAEPEVVKFCTWVGCVNSSNRMTYHQHKGRGYSHVTVLKFCRLSWCSSSRGFVSDSWATCHSLRGCASLVLTATGFVNGKGQFSTPYRIDTPQPITKKMSHVITSATPTAVPN